MPKLVVDMSATLMLNKNGMKESWDICLGASKTEAKFQSVAIICFQK